MKLFRISNVLILTLATSLGSLLFWTSQSVQREQDELSDLLAQSRHEQESLNVLSAEWDYLNRPQRLEELARTYLKVERPEEEHIVTDVNALAEPATPILPVEKPIMQAVMKPPLRAVPKHAPVIERNDSAQFDQLMQNLSEGGQ